MLLLVLVKVTHNPTLTAKLMKIIFYSVSVFNIIFQSIMHQRDKAKRTQLNIHLHFLPLGIVRQS